MIAKLLEPKWLKDIRSFLGHTGFYRRFIKDFSKIASPVTNLFVKNVPFHFDDEYLKTWEELKQELVFAPIISAPDWTRPFVTPRSHGYGDVTATYIRRSELPSRIYATHQYRQESEYGSKWCIIHSNT